MAKLSIQTEDGREQEIVGRSYVSFKDAEGEEFVWEWEALDSIHKELEKILRNAEDIVAQVKKVLPDPMIGGQIYR